MRLTRFVKSVQVKMQEQPDAYEFSIKTPVTPARWEDYDTVRSFCHPHLITFTCPYVF
jgi:hypothetical protein